MENIIKGKTISFVGRTRFETEDIIRALMLGAKYAADGIGYNTLEEFEKEHAGIAFDLFIHDKADEPHEDPDVADGLIRKYPDVQVMDYAEFEALSELVRQKSSFDNLSYLVQHCGFQLTASIPAPHVLESGRIQMDTAPSVNADDDLEWGDLLLDYLAGLPSVLARFREVGSEDIPFPDDDIRPVRIRGLENTVWEFQPERYSNDGMELLWTAPLGKYTTNYDFSETLYASGCKWRQEIRCICSASRLAMSRLRLHTAVWVDNATGKVEGLWILEQPNLREYWKDFERVADKRADRGDMVREMPAAVESLLRYYFWRFPEAVVPLYGTQPERYPVSAADIRGKIVYGDGTDRQDFPVNYGLMAMGAADVRNELTDDCEVAVADENAPSDRYAHLKFVPQRSFLQLLRAELPDFLALVRGLLANGYVLRNPSDEGSGRHDLHQGAVLSHPADLPQHVLAYIQSSDFVASWLQGATRRGGGYGVGYREVAIGEQTAHLKWVADADSYRMSLQRGDGEQQRIDNLQLMNGYLCNYWTHRVMAYLNADPYFDSVDGLIIVAGMDNLTGQFQLVAVSRVWT